MSLLSRPLRTVFFALVLLLSGAPLVSAETCVTSACHADLAEISEPHFPGWTDECTSCHDPVLDQHPVAGQQSFALISTEPELCSNCHDLVFNKKHVHPPVADGSCSSCHSPHGYTAETSIKGDGLRNLCLMCHDGFEPELDHIHGPVAVGACTVCHDPHQSDNPFRLLKPMPDLCLSCHETFAEGLNSAPVVHPPVLEETCTSCHLPHQSAQLFLLKEKMPDLCVTCHEEVGKSARGAKHKHRALQGEKGCGQCHSTHFSARKGLLPTSQKELCLDCHRQDKRTNPEGLVGLEGDLSGNELVHGPIRDGECSACHNPHGSDYAKLLSGSYPGSFYAPYQEGAYDFCLECHDKNLLRFEDTSIYTEFRNGKQNLHYLHVVNTRKGRTCRACHDPHVSKLPALINEKGASFGEWAIPTRYEKTETGGSCTPGCHRTVTYDRRNPSDYSKK
ncbi:MAG: cytochrome c3 family protein [Desulfuromonadales bacterium]|nr:cytochrome c3 family protein [Desulfuromonadales bacterium]